MSFVIKLVQFIIFLIIQTFLLPLGIIGSVLLIVKSILNTKKYNISAMAGNPLVIRWIMHVFGTRRDEYVSKIITEIPIISLTGLWLFIGPAFIANKVCGYLPGLAKLPKPEETSLLGYMGCRTDFFDKSIEKDIDNFEQFIIMGAGFDTRALRYCKGKNIKVFELDKVNTQNCKIKTLNKAGINYECITFVSIDFNKKTWMGKLINHGFDTSKRTYFLWEGVTMYLEEEIIKHTLKTVAAYSGKDSVISFDFFSRELIHRRMKNVNRITGENMIFGIDLSAKHKKNVENILNESQFYVKELKLAGKKREKKKPFAGLVEAVKK